MGSLRLRIAAAAALGAFAPLAFVGMLVDRRLDHHVGELFFEAAVRRADIIAHGLRDDLTMIDRASETLAADGQVSYAVWTGDFNAVAQRLDIRRRAADADATAMIDSSGRIVAASGRSLAACDLRLAARGEVGALKCQGQTFLVSRRTIETIGDNDDWTVVAAIDAARFLQHARTNSFDPAGLWLGAERLAATPDVPPVGDAPERLRSDERQHIEHRVIASPAGPSFQFIQFTPMSGLDEARWADLSVLGAAGLLAAVVAALVVGWAVGRTLKPLADLRRRAEAVGAGRFDVADPNLSIADDEIGEASRAFDAMAQKLREQRSDQEALVAERTKDLRAAIDRLDALQEVSRLVGATFDADAVLDAAMVNAQRIAAADAAVLLDWRPISGRFILRDHRQLEPAFVEGLKRQPPLGRGGLFGRLLEGRSVIELENALRLPASSDILSGLPWSRDDYRSMVVVALRRKEILLGCVILVSKEPGRRPAGAVDSLVALSGQAAAAVEKAELFHESEQRKQQLEAASAYKTQFLASMSHELRTPLNAILGYAELLAEDAADAGLTQQLEDVNRIRTAGQHLLSLINNILDLSKIEAGRIDLDLQDVDVAALVEEVRGITVGLIERNRNRLEIEAEDLPPWVYTDPGRLRQCLINLIGNAAKFTHQGVITLRAAHRDTRIHISIADNGVGMTPEQQARLFVPFSQGDSSVANRYGGTGLGLAITRSLVELLGGEISVDSAPGRGSVFSFSIPNPPRPGRA